MQDTHEHHEGGADAVALQPEAFRVFRTDLSLAVCYRPMREHLMTEGKDVTVHVYQLLLGGGTMEIREVGIAVWLPCRQ